MKFTGAGDKPVAINFFLITMAEAEHLVKGLGCHAIAVVHEYQAYLIIKLLHVDAESENAPTSRLGDRRNGAAASPPQCSRVLHRGQDIFSMSRSNTVPYGGAIPGCQLLSELLLLVRLKEGRKPPGVGKAEGTGTVHKSLVGDVASSLTA